MLKANFLYYGMVIGINQTATDRMRILQLALHYIQEKNLLATTTLLQIPA